MPHPELNNQTAFAVEPMVQADVAGRSIMAVVVKATLAFDALGRVMIAKPQPVSLVGELVGDGAKGWYRIEPETAYHKRATDIAVIGNAVPPQADIPYFDAGIRVGALSKRIRVFGERCWRMVNGQAVMIGLSPARETELSYANAFGGWQGDDTDNPTPLFEPRNPAGTGFGKPLQKNGDQQRLPTIENPDELIREYGQSVAPTGLGFLAPHWEPRASYAGTYDAQWEKSRKPLLPENFDIRFFNAASNGLVANGYIQGNERIDLVNLLPSAKLSVQLPGFPAPVCEFFLRSGKRQQLPTSLDTIIVDTASARLQLLWRTHLEVRDVATNVRAINVSCDHPAALRRIQT